jgi:hypothetical protein
MMTMLIEAASVFGVTLFSYLTIKEKDLRYALAFLIGLFACALIEPSGIAGNMWRWSGIAQPFSYMIFNTPLAVYLNYASSMSLVVLLTKYMSDKRRYKHVSADKDDKRVAYTSIIFGVMLVLLYLFIRDFSVLYGMMFVLFGLYLTVRTPVIFYAGIMLMTADFILEHLYMLAGQLTYMVPYGTVGITFYLFGAIFSASAILVGNKLTVK